MVRHTKPSSLHLVVGTSTLSSTASAAALFLPLVVDDDAVRVPDLTRGHVSNGLPFLPGRTAEPSSE